MRRPRRCALLVLAALAGPVLADTFDITVYSAPRLDGVVLDGRLDESGWQQAPLAGGFTLFGKDTPAEPPTFFRLAFDATCLYVGVHCDEPDMEHFTPEPQARDARAVFHGEAIEIFLDPAHSHSLYYQFAVNAAASIYDSRGEDPTWSADVRAAVAVAGTGWSVEVALPWKDLGVEPRPGAVLGINLCRDRYLGERQWSNWARTTTGFHDPIRFGHVILEAAPEALPALSDELRKGDRSGAIVLYTQEGQANTSYRALAEAALASLRQDLDALRQQADAETSPAARAELAKLATAYAEQSAKLAARIGEGARLDARDWHVLDREVGSARAALSQAVWVARLNALLSEL